MKKFSIFLLLTISLNLSCENRMCGCFNPPPLTFNLVVKNPSGEDLLNPSTTGYYSIEQIKLYKKEADGSVTPLKFEINKPIPAGNMKLDYYQLVSPALVVHAGIQVNVAYLQFKEEEPYRVDLTYEQRANKMTLAMAGFDIPKDEKMLPYLNAVFYFTKNTR